MLSEHDFAEMASAKNCVTFEIVDRNIFIWNCRSFKASCWKLSWSWLWLLLLLGVHLLTIHIFLDLETRRHSVFRRILGRFGRNFAWCMPGYIWNVDLWWVLVGDKERNTRRWFQRVIFIALLMRNRMVIVLWWVHRSVVRWMMPHHWCDDCWWDEWCWRGTGCGVWDWIKVLNCVIPVLSTLEIDTCDIFCSTEGSRARR